MNESGKRNKYCLLLTGCITPKDAPFLERKDPRQREIDYLQSLKFYLSNCNCPIVFCDNSDTKSNKILHLIKQSTRNDVEYITFEGRDYPRHLGKGYGEALIIKKALERSTLISQSDILIKVTGRLIINNIEKILSIIDNESIEYQRIFIGDLKEDLTYCNSRFFFFNKEFFVKYFNPHLEKINDTQKIYFEHILAMAILASILDGKSYANFPCLPQVSGYSGTFNEKLTPSYISFKKRSFFFFLIKKISRSGDYF